MLPRHLPALSRPSTLETAGATAPAGWLSRGASEGGLDEAEAIAAVRALHPAWPLTLAREVAARRLNRSLAEEAAPSQRSPAPPAALLRRLATPAFHDSASSERHASFHIGFGPAPPSPEEATGTGSPA